MKFIIIVLVAFLSVSCHKSTVSSSNPIAITDSTPKQYGTPFANVPDSRDVSIYQVNIREFTPGNFQAVTARLDSIKALGINVVYLMPIYPVGQLNSVNSPYCVKDYLSVNQEFGTLNDLRNLVELAHLKNMAVLFDWVANHTAWDNNWMVNKSWYLQDANGNVVSPPGMGWNDVAQLNFNNTAMRLAMIKAMKYWVYTANIDGFRCDYADGPPVDFWQQAIDTLRNITTHKLLLLAEGSRSANFSAGFDYNFGFNFFSNLVSVFSNLTAITSFDALNTSEYVGAIGNQQVVRYTSNHDVDGSTGTPLQLFGGRTGAMASFVVIDYMQSVPMIYSGQEVGTPVQLVFPFNTTKIDWTINPDITAEYEKIMAFRNNSTAIRRGQLTSFSNNDICAFTKQSGAEEVLVLINLRNKVINYTLPAVLTNSSWTDAFTNAPYTLTNQFSLQPYSYWVMKK